MKRIVIDLDVITVYLWDNDARAVHARHFVEKTKQGAFKVIVPYTLIELAEKWKYADLRERVLDFYRNSGIEIRAEDVKQKLEDSGVNDKELVIRLVSIGVKEEDAALVMIASLFADCLVTFNRKHLRNKEKEINKVLKSFGLMTIGICSPQEVKEEKNGN